MALEKVKALYFYSKI